MTPRRVRSARRGLSLLEVILALAIFVGAVAILNELLHQGLRASADHRLRTTALLLAESKLEEFASGIERLRVTPDPEPCPGQPGWQWSSAVEPTAIAGLMRVAVRVEHRPDEATDESYFQLDLQRWVAISAPAAREAPAAPKENEPETSVTP